MFKKVNTNQGSPICTAEVKWYIVARDDDKYARWMLSIGEKLGDFIKLATEEAEKDKGTERATDVFSASYDISKVECIASSELASREENGKYIDIPYKVANCSGKRFIMATRDGRALTEEESSRFAHYVELFSSVAGNTIIAHWTLSQNDELYDGIYQVKFDDDLNCAFFRSWEMSRSVVS